MKIYFSGWNAKYKPSGETKRLPNIMLTFWTLRKGTSKQNALLRERLRLLRNKGKTPQQIEVERQEVIRAIKRAMKQNKRKA